MARSTLIALLALCALLAAVLFGTARLIKQSRSTLVEQFAEERLKQVDEMSRLVHGDLDGIAADLRFVGQLVQTSDSLNQRTREIGALLVAAKQYHLVSIYDLGGHRILAVTDPEPQPGLKPELFEAPMRDTARAALTRSAGELESTVPLEVNGGWFRIFATPLPAVSARAPGAVAVLVDTQQLFAKLRLATTDAESRLILLGPRGRPTSATHPALAGAVALADQDRARFPEYAAVLDMMRAGERGVRYVGATEAAALGLGGARMVAAIARIAVKGRGHWSVATLTSTERLNSHERAIVLRLAAAAVLAALCLFAFGAYLVISTRRAGVLREKLRLSEQLALLHATTEKILDNIPTGVMTLSADCKITALNRALADRVPRSAVGQPLGRAFPDAPQAVVALISSLLDTSRAGSQVMSLYGERLPLFGEEGQYNLHAVPLDASSANARSLLVIEDLSQVRSLESQLLRAEKLATVGELAAGVAHEMGTPLGVVRGRAEYVLGKLGGGHPQASGISDIIEQIDQVTRTIRQLLDFSRVSPASVQSVELPEVAQAIVELLHFEAERRKLSLQLDISDNLEPLSADPDQLQQVLVNLTRNAFDACAPGGRVILRAHPELKGASLWNRIHLEVEDNGCGIPPKDQHRVFDPFFTTKKRGQGTGLGLAIAAQVVRNHGAEILIDSDEGRGTRVIILWPVAAGSEERRVSQS
jgi:two-component system, NtrC family, sensor histidine kinase HydH